MKLPIGPMGMEALQHAVAESQRLGHNQIGTEHLLVGIVKVTSGDTARELARSGLILKELRDHVATLVPPSPITEGEYLDEATLAKRKRALEEHQRRVEEDQRISNLRAIVADRQEAIAIRALVSDLKTSAQQQGISINEQGLLGRWVRWATNRAEQLDPIPRLLLEEACR